MSLKVAAFSGSLRKDSFTTKLILSFKGHAPKGVELNLIDISQLPMINQDLEDELPAAVKELHKTISNTDAILLATPEYNRSYSPVIKNALDWGSRPEGKSKWKNKPVAIVGCTPHSLGAFGAVNHLRQVVMYLDMAILQQPEFYLTFAEDKFDKNGKLIDKDTKKLMADFWKKFVAWSKKVG